MLLLLGVLGQCGNPKTNTVAELETEVKLLKKEIYDQQKIHDRIDVAIEKLTDVSNSIHRMLAVHEEIQKIKDELIARVGVLEKWRHVLIGGSIVIGFILHKFINFST